MLDVNKWKLACRMSCNICSSMNIWYYYILWPDFIWYTGMWSLNGDHSGQCRSISMTSQWPLIMTSQWVMTLLGMHIVKSQWVMTLLGTSIVMSQWVMTLLCVHIMAAQCVIIIIIYSDSFYIKRREHIIYNIYHTVISLYTHFQANHKSRGS